MKGNSIKGDRLNIEMFKRQELVQLETQQVRRITNKPFKSEMKKGAKIYDIIETNQTTTLNFDITDKFKLYRDNFFVPLSYKF